MTQTVQKREDANLYRLYQALVTDPDPPAIDSYAPFGPWLDIAMGMHEARMKNGVMGVKNYIKAFNNLKQKTEVEKRLIQLLSSEPPLEEPAEEEDADPRMMRGRDGKHVFRTLTEEDIDALPDIEYLVSGLLQTEAVSLLFGDSNTGKTFNALHIGKCVAQGMSWIGRPVKQGLVLYIYAEGRLGIKPRLQAWRKYFQVAPTSNIRFLPYPVHLLQDHDALMRTISQQEQPPLLLVIDPYSMCATGTNQNDQMEVTRTLEIAHEMVRVHHCHVLVVHHANRQGLFNGTAAFKNHVDTMIELTKEDKNKKDSPILMRCEKQRDGEYFDDIRLSLHRVELGLHPTTLEMRSSCVVVANNAPVKTVVDADREREEMLKVLYLHKKLSTSQWKRISTKELGVSHRGFYDHIDHFKRQNLIRFIDHGNGKGTDFFPLTEEVS